MPVPQQESSQDHLIAPRIYIFTIRVAKLFLISFATQHLPSCFLWGPTLWCFTPFSIPALFLGHLFFAHVPSSKFMSLTPTSPSYKCPHLSFAHLPAPETTSANDVVGNLSWNGSRGTLCIFPFNLMPFPTLSQFMCNAISFPPSVSLLILCLKDFK